MDEIESCVPPGFRFHPTEEELVGYYLKRKVNSQKIDLDIIVDIDLYRMEPWDIQEKCKLGYDEQNEWYFFSHKDRKYPTGTRTNRATTTGFWKATGRDKDVLANNKIIGMRKTLVFYKGRAPNGKKTDWIIHEYRLQTTHHAPPQEEGWVVCRAFKKPSPNHKQGFEAWKHHNNYFCIRNNYPSDSLNQGTNSFEPQKTSNNFEQEFNSNSVVNDLIENELIMELPALYSPSFSRNLPTTQAFDQQSEPSRNSNWEIMDYLFFNQPSLQLVVDNHDYDLQPHNQVDSSLDAFTT